jgi:hypothetical protein
MISSIPTSNSVGRLEHIPPGTETEIARTKIVNRTHPRAIARAAKVGVRKANYFDACIF